MLLDKKISGGQRPGKRESSVFRHRVLISKLSCSLTLHLPTLPPQEHYKGRYSLDIDLLTPGLLIGYYNRLAHSIRQSDGEGLALKMKVLIPTYHKSLML